MRRTKTSPLGGVFVFEALGLAPLAILMMLPLVLAACSGADASGTGDDRLFVPEGLSVTKPTFNLLALTLQQRSAQTEVYLALRNDGERPACTAAFTVALLDANGDTLATGTRGLSVRQFYRFKPDESEEQTVAGCVAPGEVTMGAILDLDLGRRESGLEGIALSYWLTYWNLMDITKLPGAVTLENVRTVMQSDGVTYTGELVNELVDEPRAAAVSVFPVNRVGRPLGVAYSQGSAELAPGERWKFETSSVPESGTGFAAYPVGQ
jgi:hypothetical protein